MQTKAYWDFKIDNVDIIQQLPDSKNQAVLFFIEGIGVIRVIGEYHNV